VGGLFEKIKVFLKNQKHEPNIHGDLEMIHHVMILLPLMAGSKFKHSVNLVTTFEHTSLVSVLGSRLNF
jgi:hypothetical protein